ncbi:hypothetical protein [Pantanalinema sp. GBBB05]|uniref:hypothetical protein n=1 Tax=Pantanalinema sp. GBBB05 TaxID=2604139 RepID=UPI001DC94F0A|nr:hypothetical protein [Pantanalinema sp. GBBB05]
MSEYPSQFRPEELQQWQESVAEADRYNILCHCRDCDREWVASTREVCQCGSTKVEHIACWQFPDD